MNLFPLLSTRSNQADSDGQRVHRRYFRLSGITIQVESDFPLAGNTFSDKLKQFEVEGPGADTVVIRHHFALPHIEHDDLGELIYRKPPWAIYRRNRSWIYAGISSETDDRRAYPVTICNDNHSLVSIYNGELVHGSITDLGTTSLSFLPTDQILLARVLADRQACLLHSAGATLNGKGLLFIGHSGAGKTTISRLLSQHGQILCDDRNIVRRWPEGFRVHGTWSHGELPVVSSNSAPLQAILFLRKAKENRLSPIADRTAIVAQLASCVVKALVTRDWWEKELDLIGQIARQVPCYNMEFDTSGGIVDLLADLCR